MSPELVLVDPELAGWARERLPERRDTLISGAPAARAAGAHGHRSVVATKLRPPIRRRSRLAIAATTGVVIVAAAVLTVGSDGPGVRVPAADRSTLEVGNEPPGPAGPTKGAATATSRAARDASRVPVPGPSARAKTAAIATPARRFVWAPRPGASGYHVELFKGRALVFRAATSKPEIVIPRRWRLNGRTHTLQPGSYRWYVWARVGGRREAKATVQAKLVLTTR